CFARNAARSLFRGRRRMARFFNKVKQSVGKRVLTAKVRSKEALGVTKVGSVTRLAIVFFVFVVTGLAPTCKSRSLLHKSPEDTLKAFFGAANEGKYSEAESYL